MNPDHNHHHNANLAGQNAAPSQSGPSQPHRSSNESESSLRRGDSHASLFTASTAVNTRSNSLEKSEKLNEKGAEEFDEKAGGLRDVPEFAIDDDDEKEECNEEEEEEDNIAPLRTIPSIGGQWCNRRASNQRRGSNSSTFTGLSGFTDLARTASQRSRRMSGTEATQMEMMLRTQTRESGIHKHGEGMDEGVIEKRMTLDFGHGPEEVIIVDWLPNDPEDPMNWSAGRKRMIIYSLYYLVLCTAVNATSFGVMAEWGMPWFGTNHTGYSLSSTMYLLAIAITPMFLAPLSEMYGRNKIYLVTTVLNAVLFIPQALSHSYSGLLAARWFQGMASSVGNSMVGGTIADLYPAHERGLKINLLSITGFVGQALGSACFGWVGQRLGVQWCYGVQGIAAGLSILFNVIFLRETRSDVLLSRRAKKLTEKTGIKHVCASELQKRSLVQMISVSAFRPMEYLATEPIVTAISLWIGFAWGTVYLGTSSTLLVFGQYTSNTGLLGLSGFANAIGGFLGFASNYHQEYLYRRACRRSPTGKAAPEVRLYWAATGGLLFPISLYAYAWTGQPHIHWIVPGIFLSLSFWGIYIMYSAVYTYMADAYETYSSSAQASQSFVRNLMGALFPLFSTQMYNKLGYPIATTVVASAALALSAAPIAIVFYGPQLRARSKVASAIAGATK